MFGKFIKVQLNLAIQNIETQWYKCLREQIQGSVSEAASGGFHVKTTAREPK